MTWLETFFYIIGIMVTLSVTALFATAGLAWSLKQLWEQMKDAADLRDLKKAWKQVKKERRQEERA